MKGVNSVQNVRAFKKHMDTNYVAIMCGPYKKQRNLNMWYYQP